MHTGVGVWERVGWERWAAGGELKPPLGLFGLAMSSRSASQRPKHTQRAQGTHHYHWGEFQTHAFNVAASMGRIVSVMNLHGRNSSL